MGIADRDYVRQTPTSSVGAMRMWSVTTWLIVINIAAHLLSNMITAVAVTPEGSQVRYYVLKQLGVFTVQDAIFRMQVWRFITFQFLHANLTHILFNMFSLYLFGTLIEDFLGRRKYLAFYLISGVGGGVMYVILWQLGFFGASARTAAVPLLGASAGVFGVLVAAAVIAPNATVLIYGSIPAKLKTLAMILIGVAVLTIFSRGFNSGGEAAHLGGAVVGYFLIRRPRLLNVFETGYVSTRQRRVNAADEHIRPGKF